MMTMLRRLLRDQHAVAMTEFALAAPVLLSAGLYGMEASNLALTHMKVSQAAMMIADNASRIGDDSVLLNRPITESDIVDVLLGADYQMGKKLDLYKFGRVILSSLETDPDDPASEQQYIHWQRCMGELDATSSYGDEGDGKGDPSFVGMGPAGEEVMAMPDDAVMFVEVIYEYQPIITDAFVGDRMIRTTASFTVRDSRDLTTIYNDDAVAAATCDKKDRFRTDENQRRGDGGFKWNFGGGSGSSSTTSTSSSGGTSTGGSTSTSGGSTTSSGGSTTTSGGSSTTSGGTSTTSGGTSTTSGGSTTTSGGSTTSGGNGNGKGNGKGK